MAQETGAGMVPHTSPYANVFSDTGSRGPAQLIEVLFAYFTNC